MPRRKLPPRLYLREARNGREAVYVIRDGSREISTGYGAGREREAEAALGRYLVERDAAPAGPQSPEVMKVGQALAIYAQERAPGLAAPERAAYAIDRLAPFWGELTVSAVKGETSRRYRRQRADQGAGDGTVHRELATLNAALGHCHREGYLTHYTPATLPPRPPRRERWLTRDEIATLVREARRRSDTHHLARFILVAYYTGTRKAAVLGLQWLPNAESGHVDLARGVIHRRAALSRETSKRQPAVRIPRQLLGHLRRWQRAGGRFVVEFGGDRVSDIKTAWRGVCERAGVAGASPHTLRHSAITHAMQRGADRWDAAGYFGVSMRILETVYGHWHPDHQAGTVKAMERRK